MHIHVYIVHSGLDRPRTENEVHTLAYWYVDKNPRHNVETTQILHTWHIVFCIINGHTLWKLTINTCITLSYIYGIIYSALWKLLNHYTYIWLYWVWRIIWCTLLKPRQYLHIHEHCENYPTAVQTWYYVVYLVTCL